MSKILLMESNSLEREYWKQRLESLGYFVDVVTSDEDNMPQLPAGKYPLAILRAQNHQGDMNATYAILRGRAAAVMAIATNDNPDLHRIAYLAGFEDCINESIDLVALERKLQFAIQSHQLQQDLVQSQKLQSIGQLAAGIAHEINTPIQYVGDNTRFFSEACDCFGQIFDACNEIIERLENGKNPILSLVRLRELMRTADLPYLRNEVPSAIHQTIDGIERVATIVRAIKTYSHASSPEPTPTDISAAIKTTVTLSRNEWKYVSDIDLDLDSTLTDVPCVGGQINQVILNLIVNSAHAIEDVLGDKPDEKGVIRITAKRLNDRARIEISDNGGGIPPDVADSIFDPFFTTKPEGKGTGQGLSIAREIVVDRHGGSIQIASSSSEGTTFQIDLPLRPNSDETQLDFESIEPCVSEVLQ